MQRRVALQNGQEEKGPPERVTRLGASFERKHAGVDEDIPKEEIEWCTWGTPEYVLTGKYPATKGYFYKDIIAGHVAASSVAGDRNYKGIYFDGASHYYIDGSTTRTHRLLCLVYDEDEKKYYEFMEDGTFKKIGKQERREMTDNENEKYRYKDEVDKMLEIDRMLEECNKNPSYDEWEKEALDMIKNMSFVNEV